MQPGAFPRPPRSSSPTARWPQASWLAGAVHHLPVPAAEITAHFDQAFLAEVPAPAAAALNGSWAGLRSLQLDSITASTPQTVVFTITVNDKARES